MLMLTTTPIERMLVGERSDDALEQPSGFLRLEAERRGNRTVLSVVHRSAPFHIGVPSYRSGDGTAEIIVQQVGPGLFPDDDLATEITVGPGARLVVRGQSATKLYPCPPEGHARGSTRLRVATGGWLAWVPGPLIPFRDSAFRQELTAELARGARLILAEVTTPGRVAMGERDAYRWLDLRCRITADEKIVFAERNYLAPRSRPLMNPARAGGFDCVGALYLFGFGPLDLGPGERRPDLWWQAGNSEALTMVRYLGTTTQAIMTAQETSLAEVWTMSAGS